MAIQNIIEQCEDMSDEELIRALTVDKNEYTEEFHGFADKELKKRGRDLSKIIDLVQVRLGDGEREKLSVQDALEKINTGFGLWDTGRFINCLNQRMTIQKASLCWSGSFEFEKGSDFFVAKSRSRMENILKKFLSLDDWVREISDNYDPDKWTKLTGASAFGFINQLCRDLSEKEVASCIKVEPPGRRSCQAEGCDEDEGPVKIFVEKADLDIAEGVLIDLKKRIDTLFDQAASFDEDGDPAEELEIYDQLFELVPDDESVAFNRGVILFDQERYEDAAESFTVSAFNRTDEEIKADSEEYLTQILEKMPDNISILHSLASLAMENGDGELIEAYYKKIISINPSDSFAHLNLGHFYFADNSDDRLVIEHFEKFLELEPESDEVHEIKSILEELK